MHIVTKRLCCLYYTNSRKHIRGYIVIIYRFIHCMIYGNKKTDLVRWIFIIIFMVTSIFMNIQQILGLILINCHMEWLKTDGELFWNL